MNTKALLLGTVIAAFAGSTFATDALLTPRAKGNQIKVVAPDAESTAIPMNYVASNPTASPRVNAAQIKVVKGVSADKNPALECVQNMQGTPKAVTACSQSVTMPGCQKLASR
jgi:hypothetical protein